MGLIYGTSYYTFVDAASWTNGESNANALGGHLITINNVDEYNWAATNLWSSSGLSSLGRATDTWSYVGFTDATNEGVYTWASGENSEWNPLTDLIHPQNWNFQQGNFGGWDYGLQPPAQGWIDEDYRGTIVLMDDNATFYRNSGSPIAGAAEIPLSYFSIADASIAEGSSGSVTITRTGGTTTSQTLQVLSTIIATTADSTTAINTTTYLRQENIQNHQRIYNFGPQNRRPKTLTLLFLQEALLCLLSSDSTATIAIVDPLPTYSISQSKTT